jgi:hypothetical protein
MRFSDPRDRQSAGARYKKIVLDHGDMDRLLVQVFLAETQLKKLSDNNGISVRLIRSVKWNNIK